MSEAIVPLPGMDPMEIYERARTAGMVGVGGAGFLTHIKLRARVGTMLMNVTECEPMLKVDQQLVAQQADRLTRGLGYVMTAIGTREGIIALRAKYTPAITALAPRLPEWTQLYILPDVCPAGDEVLTTWLATGRRVPSAALPVSVGVVVNNVQTILNIAKAVEQGYPVTHRTLTVNGVVSHPLTLTASLGMLLREVLVLTGGTIVAESGFINGGPMVGSLMTSLKAPTTKTTGGLLVLPGNHSLIQ